MAFGLALELVIISYISFASIFLNNLGSSTFLVGYHLWGSTTFIFICINLSRNVFTIYWLHWSIISFSGLPWGHQPLLFFHDFSLYTNDDSFVMWELYPREWRSFVTFVTWRMTMNVKWHWPWATLFSHLMYLVRWMSHQYPHRTYVSLHANISSSSHI